MSEARTYKVSVGRRSINDYMTSIAIIFNQGVRSVVIRGCGDNIHRAVALYNVLKLKLGDSIKLVNVKIGSEKRGSRYVPYIEIEVERT
ncbi:MAG: DNA-binding protein [Sulfolobales archaeon]|nr:DNA-binding protein [Sulfolobales archaeon]MDW8083267.1 DNA-binding protein [Sulfolobales archaeon]